MRVEASGLHDTKNVSYDTSFTLGGRVGAWGEEVDLNWLGMAVDISYFKTKADDSLPGFEPDTDVLPITLLLMFRYPGKRVRPYAGIGGGLFISRLEQNVDLSFTGVSNTGSVKDTQADLGFDGRAGLAVKVHEKFSVFGEGRYTYFSPEYTDKIDGVKVKVDSDSQVFHFLAGVSLHF